MRSWCVTEKILLTYHLEHELLLQRLHTSNLLGANVARDVIWMDRSIIIIQFELPI